MNMLEKMLNDISSDIRVEDGMFNISNDVHMEVMREYLVKKGLPIESVVDFSNSVLEGKYPERQAYNKDGILVTFPTPQHKAKAIERGTHFEENPMKGKSNLFSAPQQSNDAPNNVSKQDSEKPTEPITNLPVSNAAAKDSKDVQVTTNVAPLSTPEEKPVKEPTELPKPVVKTPEEKMADKEMIKKIFKGDDFMLEAIDSEEKITFNRTQFNIKYSLFKYHINNLFKALEKNINAPINSVSYDIEELKATIDSFKL